MGKRVRRRGVSRRWRTMRRPLREQSSGKADQPTSQRLGCALQSSADGGGGDTWFGFDITYDAANAHEYLDKGPFVADEFRQAAEHRSSLDGDVVGQRSLQVSTGVSAHSGQAEGS